MYDSCKHPKPKAYALGYLMDASKASTNKKRYEPNVFIMLAYASVQMLAQCVCFG
jgi:hypothetical protein